MKHVVLTLLLSCLAATANAQGIPPGDGSGPPSSRDGGPGSPPGGGRSARPPRIEPVRRDDLDAAATAMFREADRDRDGQVTVDELRSLLAARRDEVIMDRFAAIDGNRDGRIDATEFLAWQQGLGSVAAVPGDAGQELAQLPEEQVSPSLGHDAGDEVLAGLLEPLSVRTLIAANTNYDGGVTLDEWQAYERRRFDVADANHDGRLDGDEQRALRGPRPGGAALGAPGQGGPGRLPPPPQVD